MLTTGETSKQSSGAQDTNVGRPLYQRGDCKVYVSYKPKGGKYYTVVNTKLDVHRHYVWEKQARMMCKRAGDGVIPQHYCGKHKVDIYYLIHGKHQK